MTPNEGPGTLAIITNVYWNLLLVKASFHTWFVWQSPVLLRTRETILSFFCSGTKDINTHSSLEAHSALPVVPEVPVLTPWPVLTSKPTPCIRPREKIICSIQGLALEFRHFISDSVPLVRADYCPTLRLGTQWMQASWKKRRTG